MGISLQQMNNAMTAIPTMKMVVPVFVKYKESLSAIVRDMRYQYVSLSRIFLSVFTVYPEILEKALLN